VSAPRREPGQGTIKQLPSGRFRVRVTTDTRERIGGVYDTLAEAEGVRRALVAKLAAAHRAPTGSTTLGAWGERWLAARAAEGVRSVRNEASIWRVRVLGHALAALPLTAVSRAHVQAWIADQRASTVKRRGPSGRLRDTGLPLGPTTLGRIVAVLRGALAGATEAGLIPANPAAGIKLLGQHRGKVREAYWTFLAAQEIADVLACDGIPVYFRLLYQVAVYTGLRRGELWALRWSDCTLDGPRPELHVQRSHDDTPKSGKSRRVPLLPPAREALLRLRRLQRPPAAADAYVFGVGDGCTKRRGRNDRGRWGKCGEHPGYAAVAGLTRRVPFHALRHTCASHLVMGTWGVAWRLEDVQRFLGHATLQMTQRYAHLSPDYLHSRVGATAAVPAPTAAATAAAAASAAAAPAPRVPGGPRAEDTGPVSPGENAPECSSTRNTTSGASARLRSVLPPRDRAVTPDGGRLVGTRAEGVSLPLAEALLKAINAGLPWAPIAAALRATVLAVDEHPLRALAAVDGGVHAARRALDLAEAVLDLAPHASTLPAPATRSKP